MAATTAVDALVVLFNALTAEEQEDGYVRISELRLNLLASSESSIARFIRSMQRVAEVLGHAPGVAEYKRVSAQLIADGEDVEPFHRLYKHFSSSWPRAREALALSETTSAKFIDARFRYRQPGKTWRFAEDSLRDTLLRAAKEYGRPPTVAEFDWWRERELELARSAGDDRLQLPSPGPYRRRYGSWEGALLHFGFSADEVASRFDSRAEFVGPDPDANLPADLPIAELAIPKRNDELPLDDDQVEKLRAAYAALPKRSRYILTARLGLRIAPMTLAATASPLGLHHSRISQIYLFALNSLAEAVGGAGRQRPDPRALHDPIIQTLRVLTSRIDG